MLDDRHSAGYWVAKVSGGLLSFLCMVSCCGACNAALRATRMNVQAGDLAYLVRAVYPENLGRVCKIIQALDKVGCHADDNYWLCEYSSKIKTSMYDKYGLIYYSGTRDRDLRKIAGPDISDVDEVADVLLMPVLETT